MMSKSSVTQRCRDVCVRARSAKLLKWHGKRCAEGTEGQLVAGFMGGLYPPTLPRSSYKVRSTMELLHICTSTECCLTTYTCTYMYLVLILHYVPRIIFGNETSVLMKPSKIPFV